MNETDATPKWFAYRRINGSIHVKRYNAKFGQELWEQAMFSDNTDSVTSVYEAENRAEAKQIAKEKLSVKVANGRTT